MKQHLFSVRLKCKRTGEIIKLFIWSEDIDSATNILCGSLISCNCEYEWLGSGPVYEGNQIVKRDIKLPL